MKMEMTEAQAKEIVEFKNSIERLNTNEDFKKVFLDGYFTKEAARIAQAIVNNELQDDVEQRIITDQFKSIGHVQNYLNTALVTGRQTESAIAAYHDELNKEVVEMEVDPITGDEYPVEV
jgi:hypothetical protein